MKRIICISILATLFCFKLCAQDHPLRLRLGVELEKEITKKLSIELVPEIRLESKSQLEETLLETGISYELLKFLDVAGHYRISFLEDDDNPHHRFAFDLKPHVSIKRLKIQYRVRYTNYTDFVYETEDKSNYTRNRLMVKYDFKDFPLTPFVSGELYYKHINNNVNKSRYGTGLFVKLNKKVDLNMYYLLQHKHRKDKYKQILGFEFKIEI